MSLATIPPPHPGTVAELNMIRHSLSSLRALRAVMYVVGPMLDRIDWGLRELSSYAFRLRAAGLTISTVAEVLTATGFNPEASPDIYSARTSAAHTRASVKAMLQSDGVIFLPGSRASTGCRTHLAVANSLGMPIYYFDDNDEVWSFDAAAAQVWTAQFA